ncbi:MAG: FMN-dependent NADH-azoreductase [Elainellaceae cyanobacterium]|uniref:FMN-dependent NADH-azoreductase n=1 Tax=Leptolyngbya sp. CCY15150 TaxID=2767772 RepID=UPI001950DB48|nr:FMN-dependent NADH-azoreductase [Leptolyngbya sp. CCY15150]
MSTLLHIDSSPRGEQSVSRRFTRRFVTLWKIKHPGDRVIYRDLGRHPVPHVNEEWISSAFTPPDARLIDQQQVLSLSDMLIDELITSERYVFGVPMYNLSVPSTFKAYIDQVVRINRTFKYVDGEYQGLLQDKKTLVVTTQGDRSSKTTVHPLPDFQEPYIRSILGLIGITDITFVNLDNLEGDREARAQSISSAKVQVKQLVKDWSGQ